ncbi:MAG: aspartate ammonia-lyase [Candidatus Caldatribacteriaceae bacterium]
MKKENYRLERDCLGEKAIPAERYWGIYTERARENFPFFIPPPCPIVRAFFAVKWACTRANLEVGLLPGEIASAILQACTEGLTGKFDTEIGVSIFQGGAGTSLNMNVNEVIANRALEIMGKEKGQYEIINPFDTVNLSQSTNDTFPTALRVAILWEMEKLEKSIIALQDALQKKEREFAQVVKVGRTELQDAVPITLGMEFGAWAEAITRDRWRIWKSKERLKEINLGGTVVGTGLNAHPLYVNRVVFYLREITGLSIAQSMNSFENTQNLDVFVEVSGLLKALAVNLRKMTNDLRLLSMGPRAGIREIILPSLQEGSSIMPGKINPVLCEYLEGISIDVMGKDCALAFACSSGQLELNHLLPFVAFFILSMVEELTVSITAFAEKCIPHIKADIQRCQELFHQSFALAAHVIPYLGHEKTSNLIKECLEQKKNLIDLLLEKGLFTKEELEIIFAPSEFLKPGIPGLGKVMRKNE